MMSDGANEIIDVRFEPGGVIRVSFPDCVSQSEALQFASNLLKSIEEVARCFGKTVPKYKITLSST